MDITELSTVQISEKLTACSQALGETLPNRTSGPPDYSTVCFPDVEHLNSDQIESCFKSWTWQEEADEKQEGYYEEDELDANSDSLLGLLLNSGDKKQSSGGLDRRAPCRLTWNPFAFLANCVFIPVGGSSVQ